MHRIFDIKIMTGCPVAVPPGLLSGPIELEHREGSGYKKYKLFIRVVTILVSFRHHP